MRNGRLGQLVCIMVVNDVERQCVVFKCANTSGPSEKPGNVQASSILLLVGTDFSVLPLNLEKILLVMKLKIPE